MSPSKTPKSHAETFVFFVLGQRYDGPGSRPRTPHFTRSAPAARCKVS